MSVLAFGEHLEQQLSATSVQGCCRHRRSCFQSGQPVRHLGPGGDVRTPRARVGRLPSAYLVRHPARSHAALVVSLRRQDINPLDPRTLRSPRLRSHGGWSRDAGDLTASRRRPRHPCRLPNDERRVAHTPSGPHASHGHRPRRHVGQRWQSGLTELAGRADQSRVGRCLMSQPITTPAMPAATSTTQTGASVSPIT